MKFTSSLRITRIAGVTGLAIGAFALVAVAQTWVAAPANPPSCPTGYAGCDAPINVGGSEQAKTGLLGLQNFLFNPTAVEHSVTVGSVLTAIDDQGTVGWSAPSASSQKILTGEAPIRCRSYDGGTAYEVTFAEPFTVPPVVTMTSQWARWTGDEGTLVWVTSVSTTGFFAHVKTPGDGTCRGDTTKGLLWMAIGN